MRPASAARWAIALLYIITVVVLAGALFAAPPANASDDRWLLIESNAKLGADYAIDTTTVERDGQTVTFWARITAEEYKLVLLQRTTVHCGDFTYRVGPGAAFSDGVRNPELDQPARPWAAVLPDTIIEFVANAACDKEM